MTLQLPTYRPGRWAAPRLQHSRPMRCDIQPMLLLLLLLLLLQPRSTIGCWFRQVPPALLQTIVISTEDMQLRPAPPRPARASVQC